MDEDSILVTTGGNPDLGKYIEAVVEDVLNKRAMSGHREGAEDDKMMPSPALERIGDADWFEDFTNSMSGRVLTVRRFIDLVEMYLTKREEVAVTKGE